MKIVSILEKLFFLSTCKLSFALFPTSKLFQAGNRPYLTNFSSFNDPQFLIICLTWFRS